MKQETVEPAGEHEQNKMLNCYSFKAESRCLQVGVRVWAVCRCTPRAYLRSLPVDGERWGGFSAEKRESNTVPAEWRLGGDRRLK